MSLKIRTAHLLGLAAAVFMTVASALPASAIVFVNPGDTNNISIGDTFFHRNEYGPAANSLSFNFDAQEDLTAVAVNAQIGGVTSTGAISSILNPVLSWNPGGATNLVEIPATGIYGGTLSTFLSMGTLGTVTVSWGGSDAQTITVRLDVSAIPIPAAGFLMLAAIGGLGLAARRRKLAA